MRTFIFSSAVVLLALIGCTPSADSPLDGVLRLEELRYPEIDALDREQSIFFLTFGNLEEHGPHIPVGADYYAAITVRDGLIARLRVTHPEYDIVVVPVMPLGEGGANDLAHEFDHIGTFALRYSTLRDVAIDMGASIASKGFQNIFLIHHHGAPLHNVAFNEAAAFVSERYGVRMVNISSLIFGQGIWSDEVITQHLGEGWQSQIGITGHSGIAETSANLFMHDLVDPIYRDLDPFVVSDFGEIFRIHERTGFQGYWSDPSQATAAIGEDLMNDFVERSLQIAELALAGEDLSDLPVYPDGGPPNPAADAFLAELFGRYSAQEAEIEAWLRERQ